MTIPFLPLAARRCCSETARALLRNALPGILALALLGLVSPATPGPSEARPGTGYALLVGIDDYPGTGSDLPSSLTDVALMKQTLVEEYGFAEANVLVLTDEQATRRNIIDRFQRHLGQATAQDVAVFYYSGHGVQLARNLRRGPVPDHEEDGVDEALYVWGPAESGSLIVDEEIGFLADRLRTNRVLVALDACHSGTGTRGLDLAVKAVAYENVAGTLALPEAYLIPSGAAANAPPGEPARHLLLSASAADELALAGGRNAPPGKNGIPAGRAAPQASVFTRFLVQNLRWTASDDTFETLMQRVRRQAVRYSWERVRRVQTPQLEGQRRATRLRDFLSVEPR